MNAQKYLYSLASGGICVLNVILIPLDIGYHSPSWVVFASIFCIAMSIRLGIKTQKAIPDHHGHIHVFRSGPADNWIGAVYCLLCPLFIVAVLTQLDIIPGWVDLIAGVILLCITFVAIVLFIKPTRPDMSENRQ
jgi:hypothetical protein